MQIYGKDKQDALLAEKQDILNTTQMEAVNSGINSTKVAQIETNKQNIATLNTNKQDKLTAGTGITITNNVISASGGSSSPTIVDLNQAITTATFNDMVAHPENYILKRPSGFYDPNAAWFINIESVYSSDTNKIVTFSYEITNIRGHIDSMYDSSTQTWSTPELIWDLPNNVIGYSGTDTDVTTWTEFQEWRDIKYNQIQHNDVLLYVEYASSYSHYYEFIKEAFQDKESGSAGGGTTADGYASYTYIRNGVLRRLKIKIEKVTGNLTYKDTAIETL